MKIMKFNRWIVSIAIFPLILSGCSSPEEEAKDRQAKGVELYDQGEFAKAELELKSAIQQDKNAADSYYYLALLNEKGRNFKAMRENLTEAVKLSPNNIDARLKLGKVLLLFDEKDGTLSQVDEILKIDPAHLDALALKAAVLVRDKKVAEAMPIIEMVLKQNPKHVDALSLKAVLLMENQNFDEALSLLEPALEEDKDNLILHLLKIKLDAKNKDLEAVISDYENLLKIYPDNDELKYALAKIYTLAKKNDKAEKLLTDLVEFKPGQIKPKLVLLSYYTAVDKSKVGEVWRQLISGSQNNPEHLLALAKWALMVNKTEEAKLELKKISEADNFNSDKKREAQLLLAKILFQQKDYEQALEDVEKILEDNPNYSDAKILKAKLLVGKEQLDEAIALLNTVLWDLPNSDETIVLLGNIFLMQGELVKAEKNFKEALEINPANLQALFPVVEKAIREKQIDYAKDLIQRALVRLPNQLMLMNKLVQIKMAEKDWEGAEQILKSMEKQPRALQLTKFLQGKIYQEQGNCDQAVLEFQSVLERHPGHNDSLREMARCYEMSKQRPKMMQYLKSLIEKYPENISAIILKSKLLTLDKKSEEAITLLSRKLELSTSVPVFSELARVYLVNNKPSEAIEVYLKGLEKNPENLELSMLLASVYINDKKYDKAVAIYDDILEKNPRLDIARNNLASLLLDQYGKEADLKKALKLVERFKMYDQPYFLDTYAWAQFKSGRINEALTILQKVIVSAPSVPVFRYHLAQVHQALGNTSGAVSELRQALELAKMNDFEQLDSAASLLQKLLGNSKTVN